MQNIMININRTRKWISICILMT